MNGEGEKRWPVWIAVGLIVLAFLVYHAALTPIHLLMREAGVAALRAPILEEAFKIFVIATFLKSGSFFRRALIAGSAVGIAETIINVTVNLEALPGILEADFEEFSAGAMYTAIMLGIVLKLALAVTGHTFFVYAAARIVGAWNFYTFLFAAAFHYIANTLIGQ